MSDVPFTYRRLTEADLPMLHDWLNRPHVAEWWDGEQTFEQVQDEFLPVLDDPHYQPFIAELDGRPVGYIQRYRVMGGADQGWWPDETDPGAVGIDQFLAEADMLGQGVGTRMIRGFVDRLFADPAVTKIQTDPSPENPRAIACYHKVGFQDVGVVDTPDGPALLMRIARADWR